ncbi:MAG: response regulator [bacterium]|nr:response regulator [bacterium]
MTTQNADERSANILIVDDKPENLHLLSELLRKEGYLVRQLRSGKLVMPSVLSTPPDLVLLDILMPEMDGYEVCRQLKSEEETRDIPVLYISALDEISSKVKAFSTGGVDYITKPFQEEEVLARVRTHLALRKMEEELRTRNEQLIAALKEREALMKEILHRTKNNMAMICSLLNLQIARIEDEQLTQILRDTWSRVRSLVFVQDKLYYSGDLSNLDLKNYLRDLAQTVFNNLLMVPGKVTLRSDFESVIVSPNTAIPCGLIVNELLTNALKYAFPGERTGEIRVALTTDGNEVGIEVSDNGVGMPEDFDLRKTNSLGLRLITEFAEHRLSGTVELHRGNGVAWRIVFAKKPQPQPD